MKVRKLLALVLTLLLVLAYGAFAAEGEAAQEPGQQTAAQPAQQEAAATQAFERSLAVKGIFVWEWNWTQNSNTTGGGKNITNQVWQAAVVNLVYKVTSSVRLEATLYHAYRWGDTTVPTYGDGRAATGAFDPSTYNFGDTLSGTQAGLGGTSTLTTRNVIRLEQIDLIWNVGGFINDIYIGRMINTWGYGGGLMLGATAGADRIKWIGKTKMFGYLALPVLFFELRSDASTTLQGDERLIIEPALVLVGPGKFLEVFAITWAFDGLQKRESSTIGNTDQLTSYNLFAISAKLRSGNFMVINIELLGILGRAGYLGYHTRIDMFKAFVNADINLGMLTITPEIGFLTAPNIDSSDPMQRAINIGFKTAYYQVGGLIMQGPSVTYGVGGKLGVFIAAAKLKANLIGGTLVPWLKLAWASTVSQWTISSTGAYQKTGTKSLGFEIDLGIDITLTDGLVLGFDFGFLMLPGDIKNNVVNGDFMGKKNPMQIDVKLLLKF